MILCRSEGWRERGRGKKVREMKMKGWMKSGGWMKVTRERSA